MSTPTTSRYSPRLRTLPWLMAMLMALVYLSIEQRGVFARGSPGRGAMMQAHFWLGLVVFALAAWRLARRVSDGVPPISPPLPPWQHVPTRLLHAAFYLVLFFAMPVLGLLTMWTDDKTLLVPFTDLALPALMAPDRALAHRLEDIHRWIGEAFYWVIGLHVLAALYHHFVLRDDTLRRMV